ncbi:MAG: hypothetical protein IJ306_00440, partial [Oscillospiraceae bacterium]|nr:hypothetical protein [Oscillospiraceae bacterium]
VRPQRNTFLSPIFAPAKIPLIKGGKTHHRTNEVSNLQRRRSEPATVFNIPRQLGCGGFPFAVEIFKAFPRGKVDFAEGERRMGKNIEARPVGDEARCFWRRGQNIQGVMPQNILGTARGHIYKNAERLSKLDRVYPSSVAFGDSSSSEELNNINNNSSFIPQKNAPLRVRFFYCIILPFFPQNY